MDSRIPLPTDNIYKFYALFGLLLFIFSTGSTLYVNKSTNELVFSSLIELEGLKQIAEPSPVEVVKLKALERRLQIAQSDKKTFERALGMMLGVAILLIAYGFFQWHRYIQPMQDEFLKLQLEKLRREIRE